MEFRLYLGPISRSVQRTVTVTYLVAAFPFSTNSPYNDVDNFKRDKRSRKIFLREVKLKLHTYYTIAVQQIQHSKVNCLMVNPC